MLHCVCFSWRQSKLLAYILCAMVILMHHKWLWHCWFWWWSDNVRMRRWNIYLENCWSLDLKGRNLIKNSPDHWQWYLCICRSSFDNVQCYHSIRLGLDILKFLGNIFCCDHTISINCKHKEILTVLCWNKFVGIRIWYTTNIIWKIIRWIISEIKTNINWFVG